MLRHQGRHLRTVVVECILIPDLCAQAGAGQRATLEKDEP